MICSLITEMQMQRGLITIGRRREVYTSSPQPVAKPFLDWRSQLSGQLRPAALPSPALSYQPRKGATPHPPTPQNSSLKQTTLYLLQHQSQDRTVLGRLMLWLFNKYYVMRINPWLLYLVMVQHKRKVFYVLCFVFFSSSCFAGRSNSQIRSDV